MDTNLGNRLVELRSRIVAGFNVENWEELGLLTGASDLILHHPRLLRSLSWNDEDYSGNVLTVLRRIVEQDLRTLRIIESYLDKHFPGEGTYISAKPSDRRIAFAPYVFQVPDCTVELDLIAVMMPFAMEFNGVHDAIKKATTRCGLRCLRADDIWEETTVVQDIFNLIFRSQVVIADFSGKKTKRHVRNWNRTYLGQTCYSHHSGNGRRAVRHAASSDADVFAEQRRVDQAVIGVGNETGTVQY